MANGFMQRFKGKIKAAVIYLDSGLGKGLQLNAGGSFVQGANVWTNAGAPTNGTSGTLFGYANPGDLLIDTTDLKLYMNTGTLASPTWSVYEASGSESPVPQQAYNAVSTAPTSNALALSGANITGGSVLTVLNLTAALGAGAAADLPNVAALVTAMEAAGITPVAGASYELDVMNSSSGNYAWTITTATGWTLTGTMTVAQNTMRKCLITFTSLTAATLQSLGEYAITAGI
jgi:hypothetical protein